MIVITTPTGQIGSQVLASLLGGGEKVRVIDLIAASGVAYRALVNPSFMDNTARQAESIRNQGMFFSPIAGDRKLPTVATPDVAAAASRLLLDTSWSGTGEVPCSGPRICPSATWPGSCRRCLAKTCASSRPRSRPTRTASSASACPRRWRRA